MYNYHIKEFTLWADYGQTLTSDNTSGKIEDWVILYEPKNDKEKLKATTDIVPQKGYAI